MNRRKSTFPKSTVVRLAFLVFSVYAVVTLAQAQIDLARNRRMLSEIHAAVEQKRLSNEELQKLCETGTDKDFIERAARDKLGYVYADEQIFVDKSGK